MKKQYITPIVKLSAIAEHHVISTSPFKPLGIDKGAESDENRAPQRGAAVSVDPTAAVPNGLEH